MIQKDCQNVTRAVLVELCAVSVLAITKKRQDYILAL